MVPKTSWYNNLRKLLSVSEWDKLRRTSYEEAAHFCSICGDTGINQGYNHRLECHETWKYQNIIGGSINKTYIQTLDSINALCPMCHLAKHMGFDSVNNKQQEATLHYAKINKITINEAYEDIESAFKEWDLRSLFKWKLDCIKIEKQYGIRVADVKK